MTQRVCLAVGLGLALGCGRAEPSDGPQREQATGRAAGAGVLATVNGRPIEVEDVRRVALEVGCSKEEALALLETEALLADAARRRGYGERVAVREARDKAAIQELIRVLVEEPVQAKDLPEEDVEALAQAYAKRDAKPEMRGSSHFLVEVAPDADASIVRRAKRVAEGVLDELAGTPDWARALDRLQQRKLLEGFRVRVEDIPPVPRSAPFEESYKEALFSAKERGVVPAPVRTRFGWHVVVVTAIEAPKEASRGGAEAEARAELVTRARRARLAEVLSELEAGAEVKWMESTVAAVLERDPEPP